MPTDNPRLIDDANRFGQDNFPFRLQRRGMSAALEALFKLLVLPALLASPLVLLAIVTDLLLLPGRLGGTLVAACWLAAFTAAVAFLWTWRETHYFDAPQARFCIRTRRLGRSRERCWDAAAFSGISVGIRGSGSGHGGGTPVARLHTRAPGFLLDGFLEADSLVDARALGASLSRVSGLPLLEEQATGPQHALNDIRHNPWLLDRPSGTRP